MTALFICALLIILGGLGVDAMALMAAPAGKAELPGHKASKQKAGNVKLLELPLDIVIKHYGFRTEGEYRTARYNNKEAITRWFGSLKGRGYPLKTWDFEGYYIDRIIIGYQDDIYKGHVDFAKEPSGKLLVVGVVAFGEKSGKKICLEGEKVIPLPYNVEAVLRSDESFKYLQLIKDEVLKKGEAVLYLHKLLCEASYEELSKDMTLRDKEKILDYLWDIFYLVDEEEQGRVRLYGFNEALAVV